MSLRAGPKRSSKPEPWYFGHQGFWLTTWVGAFLAATALVFLLVVAVLLLVALVLRERAIGRALDDAVARAELTDPLLWVAMTAGLGSINVTR
jgi:hypothetical protein